MFCSSYDTGETICDSTQSSLIQELILFGTRDSRISDTDYEQIVPSQGDITDTLFDWWNSQESLSLDAPSFACSDAVTMDLKPAKLPPSYDEHISSIHLTETYSRTASPCGSDISVLHSESDLSVTDDTADHSSSLLNDIMECIETVDRQEKNGEKCSDVQTGTDYTCTILLIVSRLFKYIENFTTKNLKVFR